MVKEFPQLNISKRASHQVHPNDVTKVLCHTKTNKEELYLIQWRAEARQTKKPLKAVQSWHPLHELRRCLHLVQDYVESRRTSSTNLTVSNGLPSNRKRKSPDDDHVISRDTHMNGVRMQDISTSNSSRSPSVMSVDPSAEDSMVKVYNGILKRKEGRIIAISVNKFVKCHQISSMANDLKTETSNAFITPAEPLPTTAMMQAAMHAPVVDAERHIRAAFVEKLQVLRGVSLENHVDASTPSLNFTFIDAYVLRDGVYAAGPDSFEGCDKPCRPDMGHNIGCEYTRECGCLEYAAVDEDALQRQSPAAYDEYRAALARGEYPETQGLPKRFPYTKPSRTHPGHPSTLQVQYRESRHPIYECNRNCNCGPRCKSRLVQKGRRVPLTIFKTPTRGWGVYCNEDLLPGEFIDTYLGEVVTNEEADRRESAAGREKASYLYNLDKFAGDGENDLDPDDCFTVDGEYMGGPTRFINHSCEPNCRQYTVLYNKNDRRLYDLAFFAYQHIPAGRELTFDYMDNDEEEEENVMKKREEAAKDPTNVNRVRCLCGSKKCRGFLWFSS